MSHFIGIDLGGTTIKAGVVDDQWQILTRASIDTEASGGPAHVIARLELAARLVAEQAGIDFKQIAGIGIGTPGPCTSEGIVRLTANLPGWVNVPLQADLSKRLGMNVAVVNDANAAAYGEFLAGAGRDEPGLTHMLLLTLGTGVGGGVILDRRLFIGPHGGGAELGHSIVHIGGRVCGCGQRGCLEQYTSATAIAREAKRRIAAGQKSSLPAEPSAKDVFEHAAVGDAVADAVVDEACMYLGAGIGTLLHAFDPQLLVLGGGVAAAGEALVERVRKHTRQQYWHAAPIFARITTARLGNDAGFIGAAALVRDQLPGPEGRAI